MANRSLSGGEQLAQILADDRQRKNIGIREQSKKIGIGTNTLVRWGNGERPGRQGFYLLGIYFEVDPCELRDAWDEDRLSAVPRMITARS